MIIKQRSCIKVKVMMIFLLFPESRLWHVMRIVSNTDSLYGLSNLSFSFVGEGGGGGGGAGAGGKGKNSNP